MCRLHRHFTYLQHTSKVTATPNHGLAVTIVNRRTLSHSLTAFTNRPAVWSAGAMFYRSDRLFVVDHFMLDVPSTASVWYKSNSLVPNGRSLTARLQTCQGCPRVANAQFAYQFGPNQSRKCYQKSLARGGFYCHLTFAYHSLHPPP